MQNETTIVDVSVMNYGTLFTFELHTDAAREWVEEHVSIPDHMFTGDGFHCEHRYARDIAQGMIDAGLSVK